MHAFVGRIQVVNSGYRYDKPDLQNEGLAFFALGRKLYLMVMMKKYSILLIVTLLSLLGYLPGLLIPKHESDSVNRMAIPERIIAISPAATEIIFALGREDKLIAVSDYCDYPPEAKEYVQVGGSKNPNFELINAMAPDLIILHGKCQNIVEFCEHKKIEYL